MHEDERTLNDKVAVPAKVLTPIDPLRRSNHREESCSDRAKCCSDRENEGQAEMRAEVPEIIVENHENPNRFSLRYIRDYHPGFFRKIEEPASWTSDRDYTEYSGANASGSMSNGGIRKYCTGQRVSEDGKTIDERASPKIEPISESDRDRQRRSLPPTGLECQAGLAASIKDRNLSKVLDCTDNAVKVNAFRPLLTERKTSQRCSSARLNNHRDKEAVVVRRNRSWLSPGQNTNDEPEEERTVNEPGPFTNDERLESDLPERSARNRWNPERTVLSVEMNEKKRLDKSVSGLNDRYQLRRRFSFSERNEDKEEACNGRHREWRTRPKPRTRHCSLSQLNDHPGLDGDPLSVRLASTFRSVRGSSSGSGPRAQDNRMGLTGATENPDATQEQVEIDAGAPPPVDDSLFYDNLDALREARRIDDRDLRSRMWSFITDPEMKVLLEMEKSNSVSGLPEGEAMKRVAYLWACYRNLTELLPKLEELGASPEYYEPLTGMNGVLAACLGGGVGCLEYLIENGAELNCASPTNNYTPLHYALYGKSLEAVKLLLNHGARPNLYSQEERAEPVLHCAMRIEAIEIGRTLLEHGASVVEKNRIGETPLHVACFVQSIPCVELLLSNPGSNVNAVDRAHRTPLHFAVMGSQSSPILVELLLKHGALINAPDKTGFTPLHIAALNEQSQCVDSLIWAGADVSASTQAGLSALNVIVRKIPDSLQVFRQRLDASIRLRRPVPQNREFEMRLHFDPLFPSNNQCETSFINTFVQEHRKDLLSHPLVKAFLHLKWEKIRKLYLLRILLYAMTVICMTTYVLTALAYKCYNHEEANSSKICTGKRISGFLFRRPVIEIQWYFALILTCVTIPRKIFGFMVYKSAKQYFSSIDNVLDGIVILSVFVTSFVYTGRTYDWQNYVGAFAILCAWTNLMLMVGQLPAFGTYVAMFTHIQFEFAKLLLAYSGLLIGFTISFCVIFVGEPSFGNPFTGLIKVLAMMAGELDFEGLINPADQQSENSFMIYHPLSVCSQILFTLFIVFVTVILMNLLVGIAVHDIQGLRNHAGLTKLVRQTKLILFTEMVLHNSSIPYAFRKWMSDHKIDVENRKRVLVVKPLNPLEKRLPKDILKAAYEIAQKNIPFVNGEETVTLTDHVTWVKQQSFECSDSSLHEAIENLVEKVQAQEDTIKLLKEQLIRANRTLETILTKLTGSIDR